MSYMMPKYDTPFLTMAAQNIAQGLERRGANRQRQEMGMLAGKANMGDQMALQELYMYSPEMASQIQSKQEQAAQARQQAAMAQQEKIRGRKIEFQKLARDLLPQAAKIQDAGEAAQWFNQQLQPFADIYDIERIGLEYTPEFHQQNIAAYGVSGADSELAKEVRANLRKNVDTIKADVSAMTSNFKKLENLSEEIRKGNRQAVSQGLVALVKIGDPTSVVRESEAAGALNAQDPLAAMASLLMSKGTSQEVIDAIIKKIDPLNPTNIKPEDLMATANAMISANIPAIKERYTEAYELGETNLTSRGLGSIFTKEFDRQISDLDRFLDQGVDLNAEIPPDSPEMIEYNERLKLKQGG